jgi:hypothetical protein
MLRQLGDKLILKLLTMSEIQGSCDNSFGSSLTAVPQLPHIFKSGYHGIKYLVNQGSPCRTGSYDLKHKQCISVERFDTSTINQQELWKMTSGSELRFPLWNPTQSVPTSRGTYLANIQAVIKVLLNEPSLV